MEVIKETILTNGITIRYVNRSRRYYEDYHHVRVEVYLILPESKDISNESAQPVTAAPTFLRQLEKMAVSSAEVTSIMQDLVSIFEHNILTYMASPVFPQQFVASKLAELQKRGVTMDYRF